MCLAVVSKLVYFAHECSSFQEKTAHMAIWQWGNRENNIAFLHRQICLKGLVSLLYLSGI